MLFEAFLSYTAMESVFSPTAVVQSMMDVEAALARAAARAGMIPPAAGQAIASLCRAELYDVPALVAASPRSPWCSACARRWPCSIRPPPSSSTGAPPRRT